MDNEYCTIYLVRHGQTEFNAKEIVQGHSDSNLTAQGIKEAEAVAAQFKNIEFNAAFSSDSIRAQRTAEIILQERGLDVETRDVLRERNYGIYDGKPNEELVTAMKDFWAYLDTLTEEDRVRVDNPGGVENDESIMNRFIAFLREVATRHSGKTILVVSHAGILRTFLIRLGHRSRQELPFGTIRNGDWLKLRTDGIDFLIEELSNKNI
jgi:probable phosphoglycerate mutase